MTALAETQHIAEIVSLIAVQRNSAVCGKRRIDKESGTAKIDLGHRPWFRLWHALVTRCPRIATAGAAMRRAIARIVGLLSTACNRKSFHLRAVFGLDGRMHD